MARDYSYDKKYESSPQQKKNRAQRNAARRLLIKRDGAAAVKGKDVDHIKHVASGGTNKMTNLRIRSIHANRADNGH